MTTSIIPFRLILVSQLWINLPLPLMVDPACIKEPATPQIWFQLPFLLPLKNLLVLWPPLLILHNPFSYLLMILTPHHAIKKYEPYRGRVKIGYCSRKHDEKICYKKTRLYCSTWFDKDKKLYYCHFFLGIIQRRGLSSWKINIVWTKDSVGWFVCLPSILYFTCWNRFCDCFLPVPLITPCSNTYFCSDWNFDLALFLLTV